MRVLRISRRATVAFVAAAASASAIVACVDLFHSTTFDTLCTVDPTADACPIVDAGDAAHVADAEAGRPPVPTAFCTFTPTQARDHAARACAWLGACESPLGSNAFGACMVQALLAFDCSVNPNRQVRGAMHDYWDCLWQANTCAAVDQCVRPHGPLECSHSPNDYTQCENTGGGGDLNTRITCRGTLVDANAPAVGVENCVASGRTCAHFPDGECNGSPSDTCKVSGCGGTYLHDCDDAGARDFGVDCQYFGAGRCVDGGAGSACLAANDAGSACDAAAPIACNGGVAVGCPSGVRETVNCGTLLGNASACDPLQATSAWDVASACAVDTACGADTCAAATVVSCARGASFSANCAQLGLGACHLVTLPAGAGTFAACQAP